MASNKIKRFKTFGLGKKVDGKKYSKIYKNIVGMCKKLTLEEAEKKLVTFENFFPCIESSTTRYDYVFILIDQNGQDVVVRPNETTLKKYNTGYELGKRKRNGKPKDNKIKLQFKDSEEYIDFPYLIYKLENTGRKRAIPSSGEKDVTDMNKRPLKRQKKRERHKNMKNGDEGGKKVINKRKKRKSGMIKSLRDENFKAQTQDKALPGIVSSSVTDAEFNTMLAEFTNYKPKKGKINITKMKDVGNKVSGVHHKKIASEDNTKRNNQKGEKTIRTSLLKTNHSNIEKKNKVKSNCMEKYDDGHIIHLDNVKTYPMWFSHLIMSFEDQRSAFQKLSSDKSYLKVCSNIKNNNK